MYSEVQADGREDVEDEAEDVSSVKSFETATSQGRRTVDDMGETELLGMPTARWDLVGEEFKSSKWVKIMEQPRVQTMVLGNTAANQSCFRVFGTVGKDSLTPIACKGCRCPNNRRWQKCLTSHSPR